MPLIVLFLRPAVCPFLEMQRWSNPVYSVGLATGLLLYACRLCLQRDLMRRVGRLLLVVASLIVAIGSRQQELEEAEKERARRWEGRYLGLLFGDFFGERDRCSPGP